MLTRVRPIVLYIYVYKYIYIYIYIFVHVCALMLSSLCLHMEQNSNTVSGLQMEKLLFTFVVFIVITGLALSQNTKYGDR